MIKANVNITSNFMNIKYPLQSIISIDELINTLKNFLAFDIVEKSLWHHFVKKIELQTSNKNVAWIKCFLTKEWYFDKENKCHFHAIKHSHLFVQTKWGIYTLWPTYAITLLLTWTRYTEGFIFNNWPYIIYV